MYTHPGMVNKNKIVHYTRYYSGNRCAPKELKKDKGAERLTPGSELNANGRGQVTVHCSLLRSFCGMHVTIESDQH